MMEKRTKNARRKTNGRAGRDEKSTWNNKERKGNMKYDDDKNIEIKNSIKIYIRKKESTNQHPKERGRRRERRRKRRRGDRETHQTRR